MDSKKGIKNLNMPRIIDVDFIEYGKRFLRPGATDYVVLDFSNDYMVNGVSQQSNFRFLREDGIDIRETPNFRESIGSVTTALVQLSRRVGEWKNPYLFAQIQSRREDELDAGNGTMHRNFSQIRFTLLDHKTILDAGALYPSLLASILPSSPNSFRNAIALPDYLGKVNSTSSGKKSIQILESKEISARYFKSYEEIYLADLSKYVNLLLSSFERRPSVFANTTFSISISNLVKLPPPELHLYKLLLIQDIQTAIGWHTGHVITFKTSDIIKRAVQVTMNGSSSESMEGDKYSKIIISANEDGDLRNLFFTFYSPAMQSIVNSPVFVGKQEKNRIASKFIELYKLIENGVGDIENNFMLLLGPHYDEEIQYHLYGALNKAFPNREKCNEFIISLILKGNIYVLPLLSYHEYNKNWDEIVRIHILIHSSSQLKPLLLNKAIYQIFELAINKIGWGSYFSIVAKYGLNSDVHINIFDLFSDYKKTINETSLGKYLIEKIIQNTVSRIEEIVFLNFINDAMFQSFFINELNKFSWEEALYLTENLKRFCSDNPQFFFNCIITIAQILPDNITVTNSNIIGIWVSIVDHYKLCSGKLLFQGVNLEVAKKLLRFSVLLDAIPEKIEPIDYIDFWFVETLQLLHDGDEKERLFESTYIALALRKNKLIHPFDKKRSSVSYLISLGNFSDDMCLKKLDGRFALYADKIRQIWLRNAAIVQWNIYEIQDLLKTVYSDNKFDEKLLVVLQVCAKTWGAKEIQKFPSELAALWLYYGKKSNWAGNTTLAEIFYKHLNQPLKALCSFNLNKFTLDDFLLLLREDIRLDKQRAEVERKIKESELLLSLHKKLS